MSIKSQSCCNVEALCLPLHPRLPQQRYQFQEEAGLQIHLVMKFMRCTLIDALKRNNKAFAIGLVTQTGFECLSHVTGDEEQI